MNKALLSFLLLALSYNVSAQNNAITGDILLDSTKAPMHDTFMVWLIQFDSATNVLSAVDSQLITNTAGQRKIAYAFNSPPPGIYRTKAAWGPNGPSLITGVMPTYHGSAAMWNNADTINHSGGITPSNDITMQYGTVPAGPGFIGGNVNQGANKGTANGISGLNVFLLDATGKPVAVSITDNTGAYSFPNIATGTYKIHPEHLGDATTAAAVTITTSETTFNDIHFERSNTDKTIKPKPAGINDINSAKLNYVVYPNPAKDVVNINWAELSNDAANITITDISGKKVYDVQTTMTNNTVINVQGLQAGFYFLNIATEAGNNTQKLVIE